MKRLAPFLILALCGAAAGWSFARLCLDTAAIDWVACQILRKQIPAVYYFLSTAAGAIFLGACGKRAPQKNAAISLPLLGLAVPLPGIWGFPVAILLWAWTTLRWGTAYAPQLRLFSRKLPAKLPEILLTLLCILFFAWCFYSQYKAFHNCSLIFGDWGQYAECYKALAFGDFSLKKLLCAAGHFNFLVNAVMALLIRIAPCPETILTVNALAITSAAGLSFLLAKAEKLSSWSALAVAFAVSLNPILSRQLLALIYGFHPIIFFVPLLLCFFIFRSRQNKTGMAVCFVLSLLVQETVAVFWFGWGVYQILFRKKYRNGVLLCAAMIGWFLLLSQKIQPWCAESAAYGQNFHFARLGSTMGEILLSPLLKPGVFWGTLLSSRSLLFVLLLAAPAAVAVLPFPAVLFAALPLCCGVCLQESESLKTIMLQYGVETETLFLAAAVLALGSLHRKEKSPVSGFLLAGVKPRFEQWRGILAAFIAGSTVSFLFCGFGYKFGLLPTDQALLNLNADKVLSFLKKAIPADAARIQVSNRLRMHFLFEYNTVPVSKEYRQGDWLILDLTDPVFEPPALMEPLRRKLAFDPAAHPVTQASWYSKQFVVWKIENSKQQGGYPRPRVYPAAMFNRAGIPLSTGTPEIAAVYDGKGIHFQIRRTPECDYNVKIQHGGKKYDYLFGFGLFPAYTLKPGQVWSLPLHQAPGVPEVKLEKRSQSEKNDTK